MQLQPSSDQMMLLDTFSRFLVSESSIARVRAAHSSGFDAQLWAGLCEMGALGIRIPEQQDGLGLGIFDAVLLMEEAGKTLVSGPLAEAMVAARIVALLDAGDKTGLRNAIATGAKVVTLALHDVTIEPEQLIAGGAIADVVVACRNDQVILVYPGNQRIVPESTLAATAIARLCLNTADVVVLAEGEQALAVFTAGVEEWKLLMAAALIGIANESIRLASNYARERVQFDKPIGNYQAVSHPLAAAIVDVDVGRLLVWKAVCDIADGVPLAAASISTAIWWASVAAEKSVAQSLHTFGGYGATLEYDIHLFNLRAKAWPLLLGDPEYLLEEAGRRRYGREKTSLPEAGAVGIEFDLGDEAAHLAQEVRAFFEATLTPELRARAHYSFSGHDAGVHKKLSDAGLLFPAWPKHMGGRGATRYSVQAALKVWEEFGWTTHPQGTSSMIGFIMDRFGSEELKSNVLTKVAAGEAVCCLGFSEPSSGSDVFSAQTRAVRDGNEWRIDGQKMFTSGADIGDYVLLLARTNPEAAKHKGLTMFIVPLKNVGVSIQAIHTFQEERTNITYYDGVRIPDSYRLGEVGEGAKVMATTLEIEHGISFSRAHELLLHAAERFCCKQVRRGQPMIDDIKVRSRLARTAANLSASVLLHYRSLWASTENKSNLAFGPASKMFSSEAYRADAADLLNLTAPASLVSDSDDMATINRAYRRSQVAVIYGGTTEIHRSMIAEKRLGLPRTR